MKLRRKTMYMVGVCALIATMALPPCAQAVVSGLGSYEMPIVADVVKDGDEVISVVVPSSVSIVVETSVIDGRVMGLTTGYATISNSPNSQAPIKVEVNSIVDTPVSGGKLLDYMDMAFEGQHRVVVREGSDSSDVLFDAIRPGTESSLGVDISQKDEVVMVPAGTYNVQATLLVAQVV